MHAALVSGRQREWMVLPIGPATSANARETMKPIWQRYSSKVYYCDTRRQGSLAISDSGNILPRDRGGDNGKEWQYLTLDTSGVRGLCLP